MSTSHELYSEVELDTEVLSADSHKLIQLLLNKFLDVIQVAKNAIENKDMNLKYQSINHAKSIVNYLRDCLIINDETRSVSEQLDSVYVLLEKNLLLATLKNDNEFLILSEKMITNIKEGWDGIAPQK